MKRSKIAMLSGLAIPIAVTGTIATMDLINSNAVNERNISTKASISINNYRIENVTDEGFDFIIKFNSDEEITSLHLPYWKRGNYNGMVNSNDKIEKLSNNEFKLHIKMKDIGSGTEYIYIGVHPRTANGSYFVKDLFIKLDVVNPELSLALSNTKWTNKNITLKAISRDNHNIIEKLYYYDKSKNTTKYDMYSLPKILVINAHGTSFVADKYANAQNVTIVNGSNIPSVQQLKEYDVVIYDASWWSINETHANIINQAFEEGVSIITNMNNSPSSLSIATDGDSLSGAYRFNDYEDNPNSSNTYYVQGRANRFAYLMNGHTESDGGGYLKINAGKNAFTISTATHSDGTTTPAILMQTHSNGNKWIHFQAVHLSSIAMDRTIDEIMHGTMKTRQNYEKSFEISENGTYEVEVEDFSGNKTKKSITVSNIDKVAPTMTITGNPTSWVNQATLKVTGNDNLSGIKQIILPNGNIVSGNTANYTITANGNYTFKIIDNAGNEYSQTVNVTNVDSTIADITNLKTTIELLNTENSTRKIVAKFNPVSENGQSGLKGYSYVIDKKPNTIPDNTVKTTSATIEQNITDTGAYYLHIKAIDNAGNVSNVVHHKIDIPTLTAKANPTEDMIRLNWTLSEKNDYTFKVYQKKPGNNDFETIGTTNFDEEKQVKVLNLYPYNIDPTSPEYTQTNATVSFTTWDGEKMTLPTSGSLKKWMEEPNKEHPKGYGKGLIEVTPVTIDDFNSNPDSYLKNSDGSYKYDVIMIGSWDSNGNKDLNKNGLNVLKEFIADGKGVLFGHDTIGESKATYKEFKDDLDLISGNPSKWLGNTKIVLKQKSIQTNYPWNIGNIGTVLTIPLSHSSGYMALKTNVFAEYKIDNPGTTSAVNGNYLIETEDRTNNYYLTNKNNLGIIQTGHSNGQATPDEQKILANTLFYLNQLSDKNYLDDYSGQDVNAPSKPVLNGFTVNNTNQVTVDLKTATDNGSTYEYYVESNDKSGNSKTLSNVVKETITSGLKGYSFIVDTNANTIPDNVVDTTQSEITTNILGNTMYLHVRSVDNVGNASETTHIKISDTTAPTMTITGNPTSWTNKDVTLNISATDVGTGVKHIVLPNGTIVTGSNTSYTVSANGNYIFKVVDKMGNETTQTVVVNKIDKSINNISNVFSNMEMIDVKTSKRKIVFTFNPVSENGQSGLKGYSYVIDKNPTTIPDNTVETTSTRIEKEITDTGVYYLHIKAIDNAGNVTSVVHHKVDIPTLTAKTNPKDNNIRLDWAMDDKNNKTFKVYQKKEGSNEFQSIGATNFDTTKQIKVLNIYPAGVGDNLTPITPITFTTWDGKTVTTDLSGSLKKWMEEPNSEHPKGYGKGLIEVIPVKFSEFNANPSKYLYTDSNGKWNYDVVFVGAYDCNGSCTIQGQFNTNTTKYIANYVDDGYGFLLGHDFGTLKERLMSGETSGVGALASNLIKINKKGIMTSYPWNLGEVGDTLSIPYTHNNGAMVDGDVWFKYTEHTNPKHCDKWCTIEVQTEKSTNNHYLVTKNNLGLIQTGHSRGQATSDEQKILANTLFYLNQLSTDNFLNDYSGQDVKAPDMPKFTSSRFTEDGYIELKFNEVKDNGSEYSYYVESQTRDKDSLTLSNVVNETITSGLKGYSFVIDSNANTVPDNIIETSKAETIKLKVDNSKELYVHIKAIDNAGNSSETYHYRVTDMTAPTINVVKNPSTWTNGSVNLTATATDTGSGVKYIILPNGNKISSSSVSYTVDKNGIYFFRAIDYMGNESTVSVVVSNIDKKKPNVTINNNQNWTNQDVQVTITSTDE